MSESQPTKRKSTKEHDSAKFLLAFHLIHDVAKSFDPILLFINHISERADVGKLIPHIIKNVKEQWNVNIQDVVIYRPRSEETFDPDIVADWISEGETIANWKHVARRVASFQKILEKFKPDRGSDAEDHKGKLDFVITATVVQNRVPEDPTELAVNLYNSLIQMSVDITPFTFAKTTKRIELQKNIASRIYDGSFVTDEETCAPPIEIYFPPFQTFSDSVRNPPTRFFTPEFLLGVQEFVTGVAKIQTSRSDYVAAMQWPLRRLLGRPVEDVESMGTRSDGNVFAIYGEHFIPLSIMECIIGEGDCDRIAQGIYSAVKAWTIPQMQAVRDSSRCPTLIIVAGGNKLCVLGMVWAHRFIVQHLTDVIHVGVDSCAYDRQILRVAHLIESLKVCLAEIEQDQQTGLQKRRWADIGIIPQHPRFFPQPNRYFCRGEKVNVEFTYLRAFDPKDPENLVFLAERCDTKAQIVVKFVQRYGFTAHELLANKGLAPELYYCGLIGGSQGEDVLSHPCGGVDQDAGGMYVGPTRMVVMAYSGDQNGPCEGQLVTARRRRDVGKAIESLHSAGLVFGDLRPPNVVSLDTEGHSDSEPCVHLIDFDWSGAEGKVSYPPNLTSGLWVPGIGSYRKITKEHDMLMFDKYFSAPAQ